MAGNNKNFPVSSEISRSNPQDSYALIQKIGSGTYGDVYKVMEPPMDKRVSQWDRATTEVHGGVYRQRPKYLGTEESGLQNVSLWAVEWMFVPDEGFREYPWLGLRPINWNLKVLPGSAMHVVQMCRCDSRKRRSLCIPYRVWVSNSFVHWNICPDIWGMVL